MLKCGIFNLSGCGGCQSQLLEMVDFFEKSGIGVETWPRYGKTEFAGPFELAIIEGSPETDKERKLVKKIREQSMKLVAIGTCSQSGRLGLTTSSPLSDYVYADIIISGCPVDLNLLKKVIREIVIGKNPLLPSYAVCLECKEKENTCLALKNEPCLGPLTRAGCKAICVDYGKKCWGCRSLTEDGEKKITSFPRPFKKSNQRKKLEVKK